MARAKSPRSVQQPTAETPTLPAVNRIIHGNSLEVLAGFPAHAVDLIFADPPFNINYKYDLYRDNRSAQEYVEFTHNWIAACMRVLKPTGSFYIAIGDEFVADIRKTIDAVGGHFRNWIVWHVTFGQAMQKKFSRSHFHILYFTASAQGFTFNADAVRVPSARQTTYNDRRANKSGKLPDDTWILRPQEDDRFFHPDQDTWYLPRICGTFGERQGWHNCQMPEALLERIILASSAPGQLVLDPFSGSGTTCVVAKKLGRQYVGIELSENYVRQSSARLESSPHSNGKLPFATEPPAEEAPLPASIVADLRACGYGGDPERFREAVAEVLFSAYGSWTVDDLLCHPTEALKFCEVIRAKFGKPFTEPVILKTLLKMRKRGG